ncbi:MAG: hypothetical protein AAGI48_15365 [Verrucomicrobiota bacterium]
MPKLVLFLLLAFTSAPLFAQEKLPTVQASFYAFRYAPGLKTIYLRTGAESFEPTRLSTANLIGPRKSVVTNGAITLHTMETTEDGTETYPVVGVAKLRGGISKALIVLAPINKKDSKNKYQCLVIDHQAAKFPKGSYKMVNMSPHPIRGMIGKGTRFNCASGKVATFKTKGTPGEALPVLFQYEKEDRWRTLTETRWAHTENDRALLCAYLDTATKRMKLRSIPDNTRRQAP